MNNRGVPKWENEYVGRLKVDTFPGRTMRVSPIEKENHNGPRIFERPHLLAPAYNKDKRY